MHCMKIATTKSGHVLCAQVVWKCPNTWSNNFCLPHNVHDCTVLQYTKQPRPPATHYNTANHPPTERFEELQNDIKTSQSVSGCMAAKFNLTPTLNKPCLQMEIRQTTDSKWPFCEMQKCIRKRFFLLFGVYLDSIFGYDVDLVWEKKVSPTAISIRTEYSAWKCDELNPRRIEYVNVWIVSGTPNGCVYPGFKAAIFR